MQKRILYAQSQLALMEMNPDFIFNLLFSDEAHFHLHGTVNRHNYRYWSQSNPGWYQEEPLHSPRVTVWAAISSRGVVVPFFFEENINGTNYLEMLQERFLPTVEEWPAYESLVFMQMEHPHIGVWP